MRERAVIGKQVFRLDTLRAALDAMACCAYCGKPKSPSSAVKAKLGYITPNCDGCGAPEKRELQDLAAKIDRRKGRPPEYLPANIRPWEPSFD